MGSKILLISLAIHLANASGGFSRGLSRQRAFKSLSHQDLNLVEATFDWLDSPAIRWLWTFNRISEFFGLGKIGKVLKFHFSKILRIQLGKIYHQYILQANRGVLVDDAKLLETTQLLKHKFDIIKAKTKNRFRKKKATQKPAKSKTPRVHHLKLMNRRKMMHQKYLRS